MNKVQEMYKTKRNVLNKLEKMKVQYKLVPSEDCVDLVLYPDNYSEDGYWFCLYRFYDVGEVDAVAEDLNGTYYGQYSEDEFLTFVKNFRVFNDE